MARAGARGARDLRGKGAALIVVLGLLAVLAAVAAEAAWSTTRMLARAEGLAARMRADWAARSALALAALALSEDARHASETPYDGLDEPWAQPAPPYPVDGGVITGRVEDASGKLDLNSLVDPRGRVNPALNQALRRLFALLEIDPLLVDALIDWIDRDDQPFGPGGAEDASYVAEGRRVKNAPLDTVDELGAVMGFTPEIVARLKPYLWARPPQAAPAAVNLNTASLEVLASLFPNLPRASIEAFVEARPFASVAEALNALGARAPAGLRLSIRSDWFIVHADARFDRAEARWRYLVRRSGTQVVLVRAELEGE
ncbi:MAG: general secretion pathway protein GspK [Zetaproteobacteria bacterium]|nr:MAG: general secretion pathway protein GspK [Zetaproteobacteria bacterium]